jgi:hypothetical protein
VRYVRFFGGNIWPARVGGGYPHTHPYQQLPWRKHVGEQIYVGARRSLFCRTQRRTGVTAVEGRRRRGGADWLLCGVTEGHSRSE